MRGLLSSIGLIGALIAPSAYAETVNLECDWYWRGDYSNSTQTMFLRFDASGYGSAEIEENDETYSGKFTVGASKYSVQWTQILDSGSEMLNDAVVDRRNGTLKYTTTTGNYSINHKGNCRVSAGNLM